MLLLVPLGLSLCLGWARGGSLRNLLSADLRSPWIPLLALGLQLAIFQPTGPLPFLRGRELAVHALSYAVLGWFLWLNRHLPGMWLVALGFASNAAAILANGGLMPASEEALRTAGRWALVEEAGAYNNSTVIGPSTKLWFLGDVFAIPAGLPLANVFSFGDVLLAFGALVLVPALMGARPARPPLRAMGLALAVLLLVALAGSLKVPSALRTGSTPSGAADPPLTVPGSEPRR